MMAKLVWRVSPAPTGPYRSFERRNWPTAFYHNSGGDCAVHLESVDGEEYSPKLCETVILKVLIADYRGEGTGFTWRALKERQLGLSAAKAAAQRFLDTNEAEIRGMKALETKAGTGKPEENQP